MYDQDFSTLALPHCSSSSGAVIPHTGSSFKWRKLFVERPLLSANVTPISLATALAAHGFNMSRIIMEEGKACERCSRSSAARNLGKYINKPDAMINGFEGDRMDAIHSKSSTDEATTICEVS